ncbi:glycosyltransferase [Kovacikia minuta CCNUW1]|uniref:glycosyltransferase family 2 protein n=1 Tax=Kovacikia minuta TaxID=2931930 RepID=UPI001CCFE712|nr:glycosyltransferase family A protein [Kovacikia minuta]UBF28441.1 glycosyltransferase [Kovacikia minuta CCNUW1]
MSQSQPTVSVIIPCYNQGHYLDEAVGSILSQTDQSFEVIVINDGSTDEATVHLLQNYQKPHVKIIHTENRGPSAARNTGIQQAIGEYILPLDADDLIRPTYLEKGIKILDSNSNVGIVYSQAEFFGARTGVCAMSVYSFPEILQGNLIFNTSFYRKSDWEKVGGYNENMVDGWEDFDFWLSLIELGREVVHIPEPLLLYRQIPNSRNDRLNRDRQVASYVQVFRNHTRLYTDHIHTLFEDLVDLRDNVRQTHARLEQAQIELAQSQTQLIQAEGKIAHYQTVVAAMQSSKFWKLRNQWLKLQQRFGLKTDDVLTQPVNSDQF